MKVKTKKGKKAMIIVVSVLFAVVALTTLLSKVFLPMLWYSRADSLDPEKITAIKIVTYPMGNPVDTITTDRDTIERWYDFFTSVRVTAIPVIPSGGGDGGIYVLQDGEEIDMGFFSPGEISGDRYGIFKFRIDNFDELRDEYNALFEEADRTFYIDYRKIENQGNS